MRGLPRAGLEALRRSPPLLRVGLALVALHLLLGVARIPSRVAARRLEQVAHHAEVGAPRYLFEAARLGGAEVVEWLRANTEPDCVVLWRGASPALEFVPALLWPRLVVDAAQVGAGQLVHGERQLARGTLPDGRSGTFVVEGRRPPAAPQDTLVLTVLER